MANKVTPQDIQKINELYYKLKTYAAVARETGFSATTVKRYVDPNWKPVDPTKIKFFFLEDVPEFSPNKFLFTKDWGQLCIYSTEEKKEIEELWEELS